MIVYLYLSHSTIFKTTVNKTSNIAAANNLKVLVTTEDIRERQYLGIEDKN